MPALMRELNLQRKPSWLLIQLMNVLESRRQARGLGWSRPWNKEGMCIFRTHLHHATRDGDYFRPLRSVMDMVASEMPANFRGFASELLGDPQNMAFTFYHNHTTGNGSQFEGLTLSLGRRLAADPRVRDRLDVILEDSRCDGAVDGEVDRMRIYACPWSHYGPDRKFFHLEKSRDPSLKWRTVQRLYASCVEHYHLWKEDESRQWSHWSSRYIHYFGPREFIPRGSSFL